MSFRLVSLEDIPYLPPSTSMLRLLFFITSIISRQSGSFSEPASFVLSSTAIFLVVFGRISRKYLSENVLKRCTSIKPNPLLL